MSTPMMPPPLPPLPEMPQLPELHELPDYKAQLIALLQAKNEELKSKNEELKSKNEELKSKNNKLKSKNNKLKSKNNKLKKEVDRAYNQEVKDMNEIQRLEEKIESEGKQEAATDAEMAQRRKEREGNTMVIRDGDTEWIVPRWLGEFC